MKTRLHLKPGQKGTKRLLTLYGANLVCVRYRYDENLRKRYKTVELIVEEADWAPPPKKHAPHDLVAVRIGPDESDLQQLAREFGGRWDRERRVWSILYANVAGTKLERRIVSGTTASGAEKNKASTSRYRGGI